MPKIHRRRSRRRGLVQGSAAIAAAVIGLLLSPSSSLAAGSASFAIVVGTNGSVDADLAPLRYADDDAARYFDLFRSLGARTQLLSRLDEGTARLHPQAAAEAVAPQADALDDVVGQLAEEVERARGLDLETTFYFVYAGHGNVDEGRGYITLEDERIYGKDLLERVVARVGADHVHLIVDACYSFFLAYGRGPGGSRRQIEGFAHLESLAAEGRIGLILSTSSAAESHEWEAFQAGVFSHEIRSGLYGAADANGDGIVSYREIAAFVDHANASIPNEKFRPKVHARPPKGSGTLVDLRPQRGRMLEITGSLSGRYLVENGDGVRLADFHNGPGQSVQLLRPSTGVLYVKRPDDRVEYEVPSSAEPVKLALLSPQEPRVQGRGAAHNAFSKIFEQPFDASVVASFDFDKPVPREEVVGLPWGALVGGPILAGGAALALAGGAAGAASLVVYLTADASTPQTEIAIRNNLIVAADVAAVSMIGAGAALLLVGAGTIVFWPDE